MKFTVILDNLFKRIATVLAVSIVGFGLGWMVFSGLIIRGVADQRWTLPREWLLDALEKFPNSARINFKLAETEINTGSAEGRFDTEAEIHAMRAVTLSPWNYQARRLLAIAQDLNGKPEEAENTFRYAVKLAPRNAELNWAFANLLARRGKLDESLQPFRVASRSKAGFLSSTIETIWRFSSGDLGTLADFAGNDTESQLAIVRFLIDQNLVAEASSVFNSIDKDARARSPQSKEMITSLMKVGQFDLARATWLELMAASNVSAPSNGSLIWNGGFELESIEGLDHFDWSLHEDRYISVGIDNNYARTGSRSLRVEFLGLDTTTLRDQIHQIIILKPGVSNHLECYARARGLVSPEGPRIAVIVKSGVIGLSEPVKTDSNDWQRLVIDFKAPAESQPAIVAIVRTPKFSYDDPTSGTIWFDDFALFEK